MSNTEIVPYQPKYRQTVRRCLYETGYGGENAGIYFEDPEFFADFNVLYYTDYEPESAFIGIVDGEPAGYLLGCVDTKKYEKTLKKEIFPLLLRNLAAGRYNLAPGVRRYVMRGMLGLLRGEMNSAPLEAYPAHLHIDLFKQYRRHGLGSRLIFTCFDYLKSKGVHGVQLGTSSAHTLSVPFYEKLGFRKYYVRRSLISYFREITDTDFYNICYVRYIY